MIGPNSPAPNGPKKRKTSKAAKPSKAPKAAESSKFPKKGKVVEAGAARPILSDPQHPYSRQLKDAVLSPALASAGDGANGGSCARPFHAS